LSPKVPLSLSGFCMSVLFLLGTYPPFPCSVFFWCRREEVFGNLVLRTLLSPDRSLALFSSPWSFAYFNTVSLMKFFAQLFLPSDGSSQFYFESRLIPQFFVSDRSPLVCRRHLLEWQLGKMERPAFSPPPQTDQGIHQRPLSRFEFPLEAVARNPLCPPLPPRFSLYRLAVADPPISSLHNWGIRCLPPPFLTSLTGVPCYHLPLLTRCAVVSWYFPFPGPGCARLELVAILFFRSATLCLFSGPETLHTAPHSLCALSHRNFCHPKS